MQRANNTAILTNQFSYKNSILNLLTLDKDHFSIDYQLCQMFLCINFSDDPIVSDYETDIGVSS